MKMAAEKERHNFWLVSGFRSMARQTEIIEKKLIRGIPWEEILYRSAYPGFSEHHTGRAIDIVAPGCPELIEDFDQTPEFRWLSKNAGNFGFSLSYPRDNPHGIAYEPWHWFWSPMA
jgi:D-alanyl-D-alanine carboxypeptidase